MAIVGFAGAIANQRGAGFTPPVGGPDTSDAYAQDLLGLADQVAYWRMGQDTASTGLQDASGNGRHGTYPSNPATFGVAALQGAVTTGDGEAVDFGGSGYGQVAHEAAFALARLTLFGYFKVNSLASANTIVNKGTGFEVVVGTDGSMTVTFGTAAMSLPAGIVSAGVEYHIAIMADEVAVYFTLDNVLAGISRDHTGGWSANTSPIQFARSTGGANADVVLEEWMLLSRRVDLALTDLDEASEWVRGQAYPAATTTENVTSTAELVAALQGGDPNIGPGHHIIVADGTYSAIGVVTMTDSGAKRNPIVVRAQNQGGAIFTGHDIFVTGDWIVFDGIESQNGVLNLQPDRHHHRLTRCEHTQIEAGRAAVESRGYFSRVDHCDFTDIVQTSNTAQGITLDTGRNAGGSVLASNCFLADHNYFHDTVDFGDNGHEAWAAGQQQADGDNQYNLHATFYYNLVANWSADQETTSLKTNHIYCIDNTYDTNAQAGSRWGIRHGGFIWFEREWSEGHVNGMTLRGWQSVAVGCVLDEIRVHDGSVDGEDFYNDALAGTDGPSAKECLIIGCTATDKITIGWSFGSAIPADQTVIWESTTPILDNETNTTDNSGSTGPIPWTAATKRVTSEVGLAATDPLIPPSGGWS